MIDYYDEAENRSIGELKERYPIITDFLENLNLTRLDPVLPFGDALEEQDPEWLESMGIDVDDTIQQLADFLEAFSSPEEHRLGIDSITIVGGRDKSGAPEKIQLTVRRGEVISIVGPTGSGKSRLLGDIESIAQGDTPTGRHILINDRAPDEEERFDLEGRLVAQLSQNMNFVMDLSVEEFLLMHAGSRMSEQPDAIAAQCFECANELAGEKFSFSTKVTQLSGGQSRALMIADTAFMSSSPIVLIDEIENAGIDRKQAIDLLTSREKIVFMSTHDPLLALSADRRIVIRNGGIMKIVDASQEERESLQYIEALDQKIMQIRHMLRMGEQILPDQVKEQ